MTFTRKIYNFIDSENIHFDRNIIRIKIRNDRDNLKLNNKAITKQ